MKMLLICCLAGAFPPISPHNFRSCFVSWRHKTEDEKSGDVIMSGPLIVFIFLLVGACIFVACLLHKRSQTEHLNTWNPSAGGEATITPHVRPDVRMWPYFYYTLPYRYESGGAWPPGMYSRMNHWQPGYDVHGWSFDMRPGMAHDRWRRNVWVKNNGSKYFIDNGTKEDRVYDYFGVR